ALSFSRTEIQQRQEAAATGPSSAKAQQRRGPAATGPSSDKTQQREGPAGTRPCGQEGPAGTDPGEPFLWSPPRARRGCSAGPGGPGSPVTGRSEVVDRVLSLVLGELVPVLGGQLVADRIRGHGHLVLVDLRRFQGVLVPVRIDGVDGVLGLVLGELVAVLGDQLVEDTLFG